MTILLICFHIYETNLTKFVQDQKTNNKIINNVKDYSYKLENLYKDGANILQLPIVPYPESFVNNNLINCHYQVYPQLFTKNIQFSFGAINNTKEYFAQKILFDIDNVEKIVSNAKLYGFDGISLNTDLIPSKTFINNFKMILGKPKIISKLKNIILFDLKDYKFNNAFQYGNTNLLENDINIISGFGVLEREKDHIQRWGILNDNIKQSNNNKFNSYIYYISTNKPYKFLFKIYSAIDNNLTVYVNNDKVANYIIHKGINILETDFINEKINNNRLKPCILRLEHTNSFTPKDINKESIDRRRLTVAYQEIRLK